VEEVLSRFMAKVEEADGHWLWRAATAANGYGRFAVSKKDIRQAHRVAYELLVGPIPEGLEIDHLCRVRHCVRPEHLELVTRRENLLRGEGVSAKAARTGRCRHGHDDWHVRPSGKRLCRTCARDRERGRLSGWARARR
jgi:hypothetical protein